MKAKLEIFGEGSGKKINRKKKKMDVAKELSDLVFLQTVKFKGKNYVFFY